jgi:hypothetical protein
MARRVAHCDCGADLPLPEVPPSVLHCPRCGSRLTFGSPDAGPVHVREDIREPIRPLPPSKPYYPLILLAAAGVLIAAGLVVGMIYFARRPRTLPEITTEGVYARRREPEPVLAIREIPVIPPGEKSPSILVDPSKVPPLIPLPPLDVSGPLAKAQQLAVRANLAGVVLTILTLTGRIEEAGQVATDLAKTDEEIRTVLVPIEDRAEARGVDYFKPGDELQGFGVVALDPRHPALFADSLRAWLAEAQGGAFAVATIRRDRRTFTQSMWFPEFSMDLTQRVIPLPRKSSP